VQLVSGRKPQSAARSGGRQTRMIPGVARMDLSLVGTTVAAVLTFFVLSYLLGDLPGVGDLFKFFYRWHCTSCWAVWLTHYLWPLGRLYPYVLCA